MRTLLRLTWEVLKEVPAYLEERLLEGLENLEKNLTSETDYPEEYPQFRTGQTAGNEQASPKDRQWPEDDLPN